MYLSTTKKYCMNPPVPQHRGLEPIHESNVPKTENRQQRRERERLEAKKNKKTQKSR